MKSLWLTFSLLLPAISLCAAPGVDLSARIAQNPKAVEAWPTDTNVVEGKIKFDNWAPKFKDGPGCSGYRLFGLTVQPGETLEFNMKGEDEKVSMRTHMPKPAPASLDWRMALRNANRPSYEGCRKKLVIQNPTSTPQVLTLIIFGRHDYTYRVELKRTPKS